MLKSFITLTGFTCLFLIATLSVIGWYGSEHLLSPKRRDLQEYHIRILNHPDDYGMNIETFTSIEDTPCLIMTRSKVTQKGTTLLKELNKDNLAISHSTFGTVVMIHGRTGRKEDLLLIAERFCALGYRCICMDLPAHGENMAPKATYGINEADLVHKIYQDVKEHLKIDDDEPEFLYGYSMGGAIAIRAAATGKEWDGLITVSTFAKLEDIMNDNLDELISNKLNQQATTCTPVINFAVSSVTYMRSDLDTGSIDSERWIKKVNVPILIIHGKQDDMISYEHSNRLHKCLSHEECELYQINDGDHGDTLSKGGLQAYKQMCAFLLKHRKVDSK